MSYNNSYNNQQPQHQPSIRLQSFTEQSPQPHQPKVVKMKPYDDDITQDPHTHSEIMSVLNIKLSDLIEADQGVQRECSSFSSIQQNAPRSHYGYYPLSDTTKVPPEPYYTTHQEQPQQGSTSAGWSNFVSTNIDATAETANDTPSNPPTAAVVNEVYSINNQQTILHGGWPSSVTSVASAAATTINTVTPQYYSSPQEEQQQHRQELDSWGLPINTPAQSQQQQDNWRVGSINVPIQTIENRRHGMSELSSPTAFTQQQPQVQTGIAGPSSFTPFTQVPTQQQMEPQGGNIELYESEQIVQVKLRESQLDPNSPLYSVKSFEELGLQPDILKGLYSMSYSKPSKIQERALPLMLSNPPQNLIGQSQSGTGKTAAFVVAMLSRVNTSKDIPQAICLAPTRELSRQLLTVIQNMAKYTRVTSIALIKDGLKKKPGEVNYINTKQPIKSHIIVGTPGIILDCLRKSSRNLREGKQELLNTHHLKLFVLDEADHMLDYEGLGDQSIRIKNEINKDADPQILLFSATFPEYVYEFAHKFAKHPNEITLTVEQLSVEGIKQYYMDCIDENHKYEVLCGLYDLLTVSQSIIFCRMRSTAQEISRRMKEQGHNVGHLHGYMTSEERDKVIDDFRRGEFKVLITTNLISRGIDISQVSLVVNYDMPLDRSHNPDAEVYLHRIGRTGRFGRIGISVIFVHDNKTFNDMRFVEQHFKINIERVPTEDWEEVERIFKKVL